MADEVGSIPDLCVTITDDQLTVTYPPGLRTFSSALWGGGLHRDVSLILNQRVGADYSSMEPVQDIVQRIREKGADPTRAIGLLTAANVAEAGIRVASGPEFCLCAIVTAGVGNAVRAGHAPNRYSAYFADTINTIVILDAKLTDAALINAVITATEAKTAALQDAGLTDNAGSTVTGTTTDAVAIACTMSHTYRYTHQYAGSATEIGHALATAVHHATLDAVYREKIRKG
ncbi:adenosylcobinamide amidohydrolase [Brevibacillus dissolubilis]|uniref:adenosylcobinamide amidohydrolase n=1 Tax=Brevibacillus dissolubilis TaxID=1844116 RepID=UPI001116EE1C|nr:adenosylcobinamide amidohydrolase [Brevibacillus dissolubilis]